MKTLTLALAFVATAAAAQGKPTVIDYPVDVKSAVTDAQLTTIQDDFRLQLARLSGVLLPTRTNWRAAVSALKRQDCELRNECLQQLATTASTLYALYASVSSHAGASDLTITGRVVNQDGVQVRDPVSVTVSRPGTFEAAARDGLKQLIAKLELEKLSPVLSTPVATAKDNPVGPPPPPPPNEVTGVNMPHREEGSSGGRVAGVLVGGLAVVSAAVCVGFGVSAMSARSSLPADGRLNGVADVEKQKSVNQAATISLATGIGAGALAVTSIILLATSSSSSTQVAITPTPGGAAFVIGGGF